MGTVLQNEGMGHCCTCERENSNIDVIRIGCLHTGGPYYCDKHLEVWREKMRENFALHLANLNRSLDEMFNTFEPNFDVRITDIIFRRGKDGKIMAEVITLPTDVPVRIR